LSAGARVTDYLVLFASRRGGMPDKSSRVNASMAIIDDGT
jgi:hypothetical protein